ncbi:DUF998 domain-containing protein [Brucepastera parasyntrophica]|uniref:DUF998 domain-containing protein n=1 Tax=Brucepastera parasyntrophica TaxID=2880008 RepID=UPI00210A9643|nr:DUF998 domain-containing protein [Brucepastera parasyntrophica]ULQ59949.1 DUF998 domain-containing protein [Brucepastera parasyntrophica]
MIFFIMHFLSFTGYALFPLSEAGSPESFRDIMHLAVTSAVIFLTIISLTLFSIAAFRSEKITWLGIVSAGTLAVLVLGALLIQLLPASLFGLAERITVYSVVLYTGMLSLWMFADSGGK